MTTLERPDVLADEWVLLSRGLFWRANDQGYTGIRDHAGLYSEAEAMKRVGDGRNGVVMMRLSGAPEFSPACFDDLARRHLQKQRDEARTLNSTLTAELAASRSQVREMEDEQSELLTIAYMLGAQSERERLRASPPDQPKDSANV